MTTNPIKRRGPRKSSKSEASASAEKPATASRQGQTKQAQLIQLLQTDNGATTTELASALSWLPHTTRAALTGLRKKGYTIISEKAHGETRYRVGPGA